MNTQRGLAPSIEAAIIIPGFLALMGLLIIVARIILTQQSLEAAAFGAARAASLTSTPNQASIAAEQSASSNIQQRQLQCLELEIRTDTSRLKAASGQGQVTVWLRCVRSFADVSLPGMPGSYTVEVEASSPVDTYR